MISDGEIRLRAMEPSDAEAMYRWENDSSLWQLGDTVTPFSRHTIEQFIATATSDIYTNKQLRLVIERGGRAVGAIDLFDFNPQHRRAAVGILIYDTVDRRQGYGDRALRLICKYAFDILKLGQLYAHIPESNEVSRKLFQNCGFSQSGVLKKWIDSKENVIIKQLIKDDLQ